MVTIFNNVLRLVFFIQYLHFSFPACTVNPSFPELTQRHDVTLCNATNCDIKCLTPGETYTGCKIAGHTPKYLLVLYISTQSTEYIEGGYTTSSCLDGFWSDSSDCTLKSTLTFTDKINIAPFQFYVILCGNNTVRVYQQFPSNGFQFSRLVGYNSYSFHTQTVVIFPTVKFRCVAYCKEAVAQLIYSATSNIYKSMYDESDKTIARTSLQLLKDSKNVLNSFTCFVLNGVNVTQKFYLINYITSCYIVNRDHKYLKERLQFDAGENILCFLNATYNEMPYTHKLPLVKIVIFTTTGQLLSSSDKEITNVPENLEISDRVNINCSVGNVSYIHSPLNSMYQYYYLIKTLSIQVKTKYKTNIAYQNGEFIYEFDIENKRHIMCNVSYYIPFTKNPKSIINIVMMNTVEIIYPFSDMVKNVNIKKEVSNNNSLMFRLNISVATFVYCQVDKYLSSPVLVSSGTRPMLTIYNVFPKWESDYIIQGFAYGCLGTQTTYIEFSCSNCSEGISYTVTGTDNDKVILFPSSFRSNSLIELLCIGHSKIYESKETTKVLQLISSFMTLFNDSNSFLIVDDFFNCISKIIVPKGSSTKVVQIPMPTILQINNQTYTTSNTTQLLILYPGGNVTHYKACCSHYTKKGETCLLKEIFVGRNYTVRWNRDLTSVYPGNTLQCWVCLNFTSVAGGQKCNNRRKIRQMIGLHTTFPKGPSVTISCSEHKYTIKSPLQYVDPDNLTITKMSDQKSVASCCVQRFVVHIKLGLKSCDEYPPPIIITPLYKTRFVVNDSFSCSTENLDCQQGINYVIEITKKNYLLRIKASSYKFTYDDIGNRVTIRCLAGTIEKVSVERVVRLEQAPFNVNIIGLYNVMWPGTYLSCDASGFPKPTISWIQTAGHSALRVSETYLLIGPYDISGDFSVTCLATNKQGKSSDSANFMIFNAQIPRKYSNPIFYLYVFLMTIIFLLLIFASLILIFQENFFGVPFFSKHTTKEDVQYARPTININPPIF